MDAGVVTPAQTLVLAICFPIRQTPRTTLQHAIGSETFRNTATVPSTGSCKRSEVASELIEQKLLSHNSGDSLIPTVYDAAMPHESH